jgi:hypothetical protein
MRCLELFADLSSFLNRVGVLEWLKKQPNFSCYTNSRVLEVSEKGLSIDHRQ